ncbi:hypothetical protein MRX96_010923 [Rhipicephalus microplus]
MPDVSSGGCASACIWRARRLCWTVFQQPPASLSVLSQRVVSSSILSPGGVSTSGCWEKELETAGSVAGLAVFASGACAATEGRASAFAVDHGVSCSLEAVVEAVKCSIETERVIGRTPLALKVEKTYLGRAGGWAFLAHGRKNTPGQLWPQQGRLPGNRFRAAETWAAAKS